MGRKYYVVGFADTRQEFDVRGVTTSKAKAEKFKEELGRGLFPNSRKWVAIKEVDGI